MKTSLITFACLSLLLVTQRVASKPSTPIEGCLEKRVVPADKSIKTCDEFATKYGTTFKNLLRLNPGLHKNCDNLDVDNEICVRGPKETKTPVAANTVAPALDANQAPAAIHDPNLAHVPATTNVDPSLNKAPVQPKDDTLALKPKAASQTPSTKNVLYPKCSKEDRC
ncbi:hypothetical protein BGX26_011223 [Mortierella sp. AD094]|nr:hypothetical protein BGX26_011223 [Mortierella sp. AD094]